ncbi:MAG: hypothetical protein ABI183_02435 [Polyangiaceae bacterium]
MNESRVKLLIAIAGAVSATGLFLLAMGKRDAGGTIVLLGWCGFVVALHAFGRLGSGEK